MRPRADTVKRTLQVELEGGAAAGLTGQVDAKVAVRVGGVGQHFITTFLRSGGECID